MIHYSQITLKYIVIQPIYMNTKLFFVISIILALTIPATSEVDTSAIGVEIGDSYLFLVFDYIPHQEIQPSIIFLSGSDMDFNLSDSNTIDIEVTNIILENEFLGIQVVVDIILKMWECMENYFLLMQLEIFLFLVIGNIGKHPYQKKLPMAINQQQSMETILNTTFFSKIIRK